jgi:hypothetical protein
MRRLLCIAVSLASLIASLLFTSSRLRADDKCGYPDVYGAAFAKPENRLGEFRIRLSPPDYDNAALVQRHSIALQLWGRLVSQQVKMETRGACDAMTNGNLFPDLWAYLVVDSPRNIEEDRRRCTRAFAEVLQNYKPNADAVAKVVEVDAEIISRMALSPSNAFLEADDILKRALLRIYGSGSVLHALSSVDAAAMRAVAATGFFDWLRDQQSHERIEISQILPCPSLLNVMGSTTSPESTGIPYSHVTPPRTIEISIDIGGTASERRLHRVLIVGLPAPKDSVLGLSAPDTSSATKKYCNQKLSFVVGDGSNPTKELKILCLREFLNQAYWVVFFCDPKDCALENDAESALGAISKDPAILELIASGSRFDEPRGPYLVDVETIPE